MEAYHSLPNGRCGSWKDYRKHRYQQRTGYVQCYRGSCEVRRFPPCISRIHWRWCGTGRWNTSVASFEERTGFTASEHYCHGTFHTTSSPLHRSQSGTQIGRTGYRSPFYICSYHFYHTATRLCGERWKNRRRASLQCTFIAKQRDYRRYPNRNYRSRKS